MAERDRDRKTQPPAREIKPECLDAAAAGGETRLDHIEKCSACKAVQANKDFVRFQRLRRVGFTEGDLDALVIAAEQRKVGGAATAVVVKEEKEAAKEAAPQQTTPDWREDPIGAIQKLFGGKK